MFECEFEVRNCLDTHVIKSESIWEVLAVMQHISNYYGERISIFTLTYPTENGTASFTEMD